MKVSKEEIKYIAKLAKLKFDKDEIDKFTREFENILSHFEVIEKEDLENIEVFSVEKEKSKLRKDQVIEFKDKERLLRNVKDRRDDYVVIPRIIE